MTFHSYTVSLIIGLCIRWFSPRSLAEIKFANVKSRQNPVTIELPCCVQRVVKELPLPDRTRRRAPAPRPTVAAAAGAGAVPRRNRIEGAAGTDEVDGTPSFLLVQRISH